MASNRPGLQLLAVLVLIIVIGLVHAGAIQIVNAGYGIIALILMLGSLPFLKRYLD